jgi:hypothetical protein
MDYNLEVQIKSLLFPILIGVLKLLAYHLQIHHFHNVQREYINRIFKIHRCVKVTLSQRLMYPKSILSVKKDLNLGYKIFILLETLVDLKASSRSR